MKNVHIIIPTKGRLKVMEVTIPHLDKHIEWAKEYGIYLTFSYMPGEIPLGQKLNKGLEWVRIFDWWDYLMILGSDDLMRPQIWGYIRAAIGEGLPAFGFNEAILYDRMEHRAKVWKYGPITFGAGRCIRRDVVESCNWRMWDDDKENGVDNNQEHILLEKAGACIHIIPTYTPVICDIKDGDNLNSFDSVPGMDIDPDKVCAVFYDLQKLRHAAHP